MALYAFDGTWNTEKHDNDPNLSKNTNVVRFKDAYLRSGAHVKYVEGVGTRFDAVGKVLGGVFGLGELPRIVEVYNDLCQTWLGGDETIDLVGFSRGAATVLDFCHHLLDNGIRDPNTGRTVEANPTIRFVGLFDVVGGFGIANLGNTALNIGHHLSLPDGSVQFVFHAMALDERRLSFLPTRLKGAHEVWFRGVHSDIGGGNGNIGLNDITLKWMFSKAIDAKLPIAPGEIIALGPVPATSPQFGKAPLPMIREIDSVDRVHYSVCAVDGCTNPPSTCVAEKEADEVVAQRAGAVEVLSEEALGRIRVLYAVAREFAAKEGFALGETEEPLLSLFEHRICLVQTPAQLETAKVSVATLVARTINKAKGRGFNDRLFEFALNEAIFESPHLFPLTD